jgi:hypothetical protein
VIKTRYLITLILLCVCIFSLFQVKFKVHNLHQEMAETRKHLEREKDSIHVLKAEWAYLNQPERLHRLSTKFLNLSEVKPCQISNDGNKISATINVAEKPSGLNSNIIKTSYTNNTKWRYKERPDLMRKKR